MSDRQREQKTDPLEAVRTERGYTLPLHTVLAEEDPEGLAAYEVMMQALYLKKRRLDARTKELIYVATLVGLGAAEDHISAHMEKAVREGASPEDVLETVELVVPAAGAARASVGFHVWHRTFRR